MPTTTIEPTTTLSGDEKRVIASYWYNIVSSPLVHTNDDS